MVVGSTTVEPGASGTLTVSVIMHEGMGGPHLFHVFVKSSAPETPVTLLKVKADIVSLEQWRQVYPGAFYLPREVVRFPLLMESVGLEAVDYAYKAFGPHGQPGNAYLGRYEKDKQQVHLLVAEYADAERATQLFSGVVARMQAKAGAPDQPRQLEVGGKPVYAAKNAAHEFFYFQSGNKVVWLYPDGAVARPSLEEVLQHLQRFGT